jgi:hypothetical protein
MIAAHMPHYGPPDALETPRFLGPRTFMRLPHVRDLDGVDVAVVGFPATVPRSSEPVPASGRKRLAAPR